MLKLPVALAHVGWVTLPNVGATGVAGCAFTVILAEVAEVHDPKVAVIL